MLFSLKTGLGLIISHFHIQVLEMNGKEFHLTRIRQMNLYSTFRFIMKSLAIVRGTINRFAGIKYSKYKFCIL